MRRMGVVIVLRYASATAVHNPEAVLGTRKPLLSG